MTPSLRYLLTAITAGAALASMHASPATHRPVSEMSGRDFSAHYSLYPYTFEAAPALTGSPDGYEPFHIEHYGRHGARWLIDQKDYDQPLEQLEKAERNGVLTPLGRETLELLRDLSAKEAGRREELSDVGAIQHQGIGERMVKNFPEVFAPGSVVNAKSTVVIRCILSMVNELNSINKLAPGTKVLTDASNADMYYMNFDDTVGLKIRNAAKKGALKKYTRKYPETGAYLNRLISSPQFIADSIDSKGLERRMWRFLSNTQSHLGAPWLTDRVFTPEELHAQWLRSNASWFVDAGNSKINNYRGAYSQRNLLRHASARQTDIFIKSILYTADKRLAAYGRHARLLVLGRLGLDKEVRYIGQYICNGGAAHTLDQHAQIFARQFESLANTRNTANRVKFIGARVLDGGVALGEQKHLLPVVHGALDSQQ